MREPVPIKKPIMLMVVQYITDGFGDFLLAINLANAIKREYINAGLEEPNIHFLTDDEGKITIEDKSRGSKVYTIDTLETELRSGIISIERMIEAPVLSFGWLTQPSKQLEATWDERVYAKNSREFNQLHQMLQRVYRLGTPHIPYTMVSEYDDEIKDSVVEKRLKAGYVNASANIKIQSGLASHQMGIVISDLREYDNIEKANAVIDEKIRGPLLSGGSLDAYRTSSTLHFQYSHDGRNRGGCSDFIKLHHAYIQSRPGNHDLVMVGEDRDAKRSAIESIKEQLIGDGFERISFYNADTGEETFLYDNESGSGKTYRAIYTSGMSHESLLALLSLSSPLVSVTGDQSLGEAVSAKKIICYEVRGHKRGLNEAFYTALKEQARENPHLLKLLPSVPATVRQK